MKNTFKIIASFFVGGAIGGGISYFLLKKKFDERIESEVQSIKDLYSSKLEEKKEVEPCDNVNQIKNSKNEDNKKSEEKVSKNETKSLKSSIKKQEKQPPVDYANYYSALQNYGGEESKKDSDVEEKVVVPEKKNTKKSTRVVISPDEFEDEEDYETIYLTYYADGVLADETDKQVKIENTIGKEALKHFGEYEDDMLHVRDDKVKVYYEVAKDNRKFSDITGNDEYDDYEED